MNALQPLVRISFFLSFLNLVKKPSFLSGDLNDSSTKVKLLKYHV